MAGLLGARQILAVNTHIFFQLKLLSRKFCGKQNVYFIFKFDFSCRCAHHTHTRTHTNIKFAVASCQILGLLAKGCWVMKMGGRGEEGEKRYCVDGHPLLTIRGSKPCNGLLKMRVPWVGHPLPKLPTGYRVHSDHVIFRCDIRKLHKSLQSR